MNLKEPMNLNEFSVESMTAKYSLDFMFGEEKGLKYEQFSVICYCCFPGHFHFN